MLGTLPPYALAAPTFRFPALASLAGRRPLGGEREMALAVFVGAHLAAGALPPASLPASLRATRATAARSWLTALALPAPLRPLLSRLLDATARDDFATLATALAGVVTAADKVLDPASRRELETLGRDMKRLAEGQERE